MIMKLRRMNLQYFAEGDPNPEDKEPKPFDPKDLSPEALRYLDQQRTQASKTASEKARAKLESDPEFVRTMRERIEAENNLTLEEKLAEKNKEISEREALINIRDNKITVKEKLITSGISADSEGFEALLETVTTSDQAQSLKNAETIVSIMDKIIKTSVDKAKTELLQGGFNINTGDGKSSSWQQQYDDAKKAGNTALVISLKRKAAAEGVIL